MEEKHYTQRLDLLGWTGAATMGIGALAICGALSIELVNHVQIDRLQSVSPPDSAYTELWAGGAGSIIGGQQILAYGYRRDKRQRSSEQLDIS